VLPNTWVLSSPLGRELHHERRQDARTRETVAEGTVAKWFKRPGDAVVKGEPLFEVSTDKVDSEIPAQASGVLSAILVAEGETVDVGTVLAVITSENEHHHSTPPSALRLLLVVSRLRALTAR